MKKRFLVSGLLNMEINNKVEAFPIEYRPINFSFFDINASIGGVAYNIVKALKTLKCDVSLISYLGNDFVGKMIKEDLKSMGIGEEYIEPVDQTPLSVVLHDPPGRREIYCDLKNIQDQVFDYQLIKDELSDYSLLAICNTNFNRDLIKYAKRMNLLVATDVHTLNDIHDSYNRDYLENSDIIFLSDEFIKDNYKSFIDELRLSVDPKIIVLGQGGNGSFLYDKEKNMYYRVPCYPVEKVVNTVGAGDALFTSFNYFYLDNHDALEALKKATIFASFKVMTSGSSLGFIDENKVNEVYKNYVFDVEEIKIGN